MWTTRTQIIIKSPPHPTPGAGISRTDQPAGTMGRPPEQTRETSDRQASPRQPTPCGDAVPFHVPSKGRPRSRSPPAWHATKSSAPPGVGGVRRARGLRRRPVEAGFCRGWVVRLRRHGSRLGVWVWLVSVAVSGGVDVEDFIEFP